MSRFDPASLRLSDDFSASVQVRETYVRIRIRKPNKYEFVRVHASDAFHLQTCVIDLEADNEFYLVEKPLWGSLAGEPAFGPRAFYTAVNAQRELFLWPCLLPKADGKCPDWVAIPLEAAKSAVNKWTKIAWDESQRRHRIWTAAGDLGEPQWPTLSLLEILRLAFNDRFIKTLDHPIIRKLRGEL